MFNYFNFFLLNYILFFSVTLFVISFFGILLTKRNILIIIISIEIMLLSVSVIFIVFSIYLDSITGQIFSLFILCFSMAEASIGLAVLIIYYRIRGLITLEYINSLKG